MDPKKSAIEIEAEETLEALAADRRAEHAREPKVIQQQLQRKMNELTSLRQQTFEAPTHSVRTVDAKGNIFTKVGRGVPTGYSPDSLVKGNFASARKRSEFITKVIKDVKAAITALERREPLAAERAVSLMKFIDEDMKIPEIGDLVVIQAPKTRNGEESQPEKQDKSLD